MEGLIAGGLAGYASPSTIPYYDGPSKLASIPTLKQRLDMAVEQAENRLAAVKEAREIFERNPDIERLLDLMQRSHF